MKPPIKYSELRKEVESKKRVFHKGKMKLSIRNDTIYIMLKDEEEKALSKRQEGNSISFGRASMVQNYLAIKNAEKLWEKELMPVILESLKAYTDYLGEGSLVELLAMKKTIYANPLMVSLFEESIQAEIPSADLWCVFAGYGSNKTLDNYRMEGVDDRLRAIIKARNSLVKYDKELLSVESAFSYFSPIFPNHDDDLSFLSDNLTLRRVIKAVNLINGDSSFLDRGNSNLELSASLSKKMTYKERLAIRKYAFEYDHYVDFRGKVENLNLDQFLNFFSRFVHNLSNVNTFLLERVLNNVEMKSQVELGGDVRFGIYWTMTDYEASVYDEIFYKNGQLDHSSNVFLHVLRAFNDGDRFYSQFIKNPEAFKSFALSYEAALFQYHEIVKDLYLNGVLELLSSNEDLAENIRNMKFNLWEIFEEFIDGSDLPFEMLLSLKLNCYDS